MVVYDEHLTLDFGVGNPRLDLVEVVVREVDVPTYRRAGELTRGGWTQLGDPDEVAKFDELVALVGRSLVSWNLTDGDGAPVPATAEGLATRPHLLVAAIINAWIDAQVGLSGPLAQRSPTGAEPVAIPQTPLAS